MRPGEDSDLKIRIARLSTEAMRTLNGAVSRDCADIRVTRALEAGLRDPNATARERKQLLAIVEELSGVEKAEDETRSVVLRFRVTDDEDEQIRARADAAGQTISEYLRSAALRD